MSTFDDNPYAAPADVSQPSPIVARPGARVWQMAGDVVVERGAQLPLRCTRCNAEPVSRLKPYLIGCWITELDWPNDGSVLLLGKCDQCLRQRRRVIWLLTVTAICGASLVVAGMAVATTHLESALFLVPGVGLLIGAATIGRRHSVATVAATTNYARLTGFGHNFVAQFPEAKRPVGT